MEGGGVEDAGIGIDVVVEGSEFAEFAAVDEDVVYINNKK